MSISFTRVPLVNPGDRITSTQWNKMADGLNDRDRSNLGDVGERRVYWFKSLFHHIAGGSGLVTHADSEFFTAYQNLKATDGNYPDGAIGDPDGPNLATVANAFVLGNGVNVDSEDLRIADPSYGGVPLWLGLGVPTTIADIWELSKAQRGGFDPATGGVSAGAYLVAQEQFKLQPGPNSPHGASWGGYMPAPEYIGDCADDETPNWLILFTNIHDSSTTTYGGTCPESTNGVMGYVSTPTAFVVYKYDGTYDILPRNDWIEGPYTQGATVKRQQGEHIPRVLNQFVMQFRGTEGERATQTSWLQYAFDFQRFALSQYFLAPAYGVEDPETHEISYTYPLFEVSLDADETTLPADTFLGLPYTFHDGCVLAAAYIYTNRLVGQTDIGFYAGSTLIKTVTLTPDGSGAAPTIVTFEQAQNPGTLSIKLPNGATFSAGAGTISVEVAELMEYKPQAHDQALFLRLSTCRTSLVNGLDGSGRDETNAKAISDSYFATGCILNTHGAPGPAGSLGGEVNSNAVFDESRRMSQIVHVVPRTNLIGYEVTGGKSVCYFTRYATTGMDLFEGIAPAKDPIESGSIVGGVVYIVRGTTPVVYNEITYGIGAQFTGVSGQTDFTGTIEEETPAVYEYEGIRAVASPQRETNEWLMSAFLKGNNDSESSMWKTDLYTDPYFMSERCHFYHPPYSPDLRYQFDYGAPISLTPEALTGWRYAKNTNHFLCDDEDDDCHERRRARYKSCRIYEPIPEIESATVLIEGGIEVVKLVFKTRFHSHDDAPSTVSRDRSGWDVTALKAETYRTLDNALREYLIWVDGGYPKCSGGGIANSGQQGNAALMLTFGTDVWGLPDDPSGACFPFFYFLKLTGKVYEDGNDVQNSHDAPLMADKMAEAELRIRIMCEGFVDGLTSATLGCVSGTNSVFCYRTDSLYFEATGGKWATALASVATSRISADLVRSDAPQGFGQLPNTLLSSECFNQLAKGLNLLTKVQIMLPMQFQVKTSSGSATKQVSATWPDATHTCVSPPFPTQGGYCTNTPTDPSVSDDGGGWLDDTSVQSSVSASLECNEACIDEQWTLSSHRTNMEWRWALTDPDALYAIPPDLRALVFDVDGAVTSAHGRVLAVKTTVLTKITANRVDDEEDGSPCLTNDFGFWHDVEADKWLRFDIEDLVNTTECLVLPSSGTIVVAPLGESDFAFGRTLDASCCFGVQNAVSISPILGDDTAFIEIPLV